jgi:MerR family mercuric resistance operon transcriptional regulator
MPNAAPPPERTIGALAEAAGVSVETVRYYQRIGLLARPRRAQGSIRRYPPEALRRLRFIKRTQALGFSLTEVRALLKLAEGEHCAETQVLGEKKLALVQRKMDELVAMRNALESLVARCSRGGRSRGCPLIKALVADTD